MQLGGAEKATTTKNLTGLGQTGTTNKILNIKFKKSRSKRSGFFVL
jgi:hypothetical protein